MMINKLFHDMKSLYIVSHDNDDSSEAFYCDMNLKTRVIELISLF